MPQAQCWCCPPLPCVDLQGGLQELGSLLLGLGQLLHAQEVAGSAHLQHGDHGGVRVQPRGHLRHKHPSGLPGTVHVQDGKRSPEACKILILPCPK